MTEEYVVEIAGLVPETVTIALKEDLTISEDLAREVNRSAAQFGYYAVLAERAQARFQRLKFSHEMWVAEVEAQLIEEGRKFKLVKDMDREVSQMPKSRLYRTKLIKFEEEAKILKQVAKAFEIKKDLIQTKSSNRRSEIDGKMGA
jgi:hypothetical protein